MLAGASVIQVKGEVMSQDLITPEQYARNLVNAGHPPETAASTYRARTGQQVPAALAKELGVQPPAPPLPAGILSVEQTNAELDRIESQPGGRNGGACPDHVVKSWEYHANRKGKS